MSALDLDSLRHSHESNTEWGLRRCFLDAYQSKFDQRRLLCLASCFVNVECYGCEYPGPLMVELAGLVAGIKDQVDSLRLRKVKKECIKPVTFVKSSTALSEDSRGGCTPGGKSSHAGTDGQGQNDGRKPMNFVKSSTGLGGWVPSSASASAAEDGLQEEPPGSLRAIQQALDHEAMGTVSAPPGVFQGKPGLGCQTFVRQAPPAPDMLCSRPAGFEAQPAGPRKARMQPEPPGTCLPPPKVARLPVDFVPSQTQYSSLAVQGEGRNSRMAKLQTEYSRMFIRSGQDPDAISPDLQGKLQEKTEFVQQLSSAVLEVEASGKADNSISIIYLAVQQLGVLPPEVTWKLKCLGGPQHCTVLLNDVLMARTPGLNKKAAKLLAFDAMLAGLKASQIRLTVKKEDVICLEPPGAPEELTEERSTAAFQPMAASSAVEVVEMAAPPGPSIHSYQQPARSKPSYQESARIVPPRQQSFMVDYEKHQVAQCPQRPVEERHSLPTGRGGHQDRRGGHHSRHGGRRDTPFSAPLQTPVSTAPNTGRGQSKRGGRSARGRRNTPPEARLTSVNDILILEHANNDNAVTILHNTSAFNKVTLDYNFRTEYLLGDASVRCCLYILGELIGTTLGLTKPSAKAQTAAEALEALRARCYTLCIKQSVDTDEVEVSRDQMGAEFSQIIPESNIGSKMLKRMGWVGGGVGKDGQGIAQPISVETVINREGLGHQTEKGIHKDFLSSMRTSILNYARSDNQKDLVFSPEFSKDERALIHKEAQQLGLKTHSHGSGEDRYIVLSRKRTPSELYSHIMEQGGETEKYKLIPPLGRSNNFNV